MILNAIFDLFSACLMVILRIVFNLKSASKNFAFDKI